MTFHEWWTTYNLPVISSRGTFDILLKATKAAFYAGRKAGRKEIIDRRSTWQTKQSSSSASSGAKRSTGG